MKQDVFSDITRLLYEAASDVRDTSWVLVSPRYTVTIDLDLHLAVAEIMVLNNRGRSEIEYQFHEFF